VNLGERFQLQDIFCISVAKKMILACTDRLLQIEIEFK